MAVKRSTLSQKIPPLPRVDVNRIVYFADISKDVYAIDSTLAEGVAYLTDGHDFVLVTREHGVVRMPMEMMQKVCEEVEECIEVWK